MTILSRIQANPEISTDNPNYVNELITRAKDFIIDECHFPIFPELAQGYSKSKAAATEDLTGLATNSIWISANGSGLEEIELTLANCTTGANTAAELQTQIQASDTDGFDEVTVAFADTQYTITSGWYGETSSITVWFDTDNKAVAQAMKLTPRYGGTEEVGSEYNAQIESLTVKLVEVLYEKAGIEGLTSGTIPGSISFAMADLDPDIRRGIKDHARIWTFI
jgi:hypothetical protein